MSLIAALDFDGTCVAHAYPNMGHEIGAAPWLRKIVQTYGMKIILYTMRCGEELDDARNWFASHDITVWSVNKNPDQWRWTSSPKIFAHVYVDDAALGVPINNPAGGGRAYVNWDLAGPRLQMMAEKSAR